MVIINPGPVKYLLTQIGPNYITILTRDFYDCINKLSNFIKVNAFVYKLFEIGHFL